MNKIHVFIGNIYIKIMSMNLLSSNSLNKLKFILLGTFENWELSLGGSHQKFDVTVVVYLDFFLRK